jgi:serine phosphatase RsbU (regulator of sigma subunit)
MHSDGIVDQFGGEHSKKLTSKNINKIIEDSMLLSLHQQKEKIESSFMNWKGSNEQTDDVLLVLYEI